MNRIKLIWRASAVAGTVLFAGTLFGAPGDLQFFMKREYLQGKTLEEQIRSCIGRKVDFEDFYQYCIVDSNWTTKTSTDIEVDNPNFFQSVGLNRRKPDPELSSDDWRLPTRKGQLAAIDVIAKCNLLRVLLGNAAKSPPLPCADSDVALAAELIADIVSDFREHEPTSYVPDERKMEIMRMVMRATRTTGETRTAWRRKRTEAEYANYRAAQNEVETRYNPGGIYNRFATALYIGHEDDVAFSHSFFEKSAIPAETNHKFLLSFLTTYCKSHRKGFPYANSTEYAVRFMEFMEKLEYGDDASPDAAESPAPSSAEN